MSLTNEMEVQLNVLNQRLEGADEDVVFDLFEELRQKWHVPSDPRDLLGMALKVYGVVDFSSIDITWFDEKKNMFFCELFLTQTKFKKLIDEDYSKEWDKLYESFYYIDRYMRTTYNLQLLSREDYDYVLNDETFLLEKFSPAKDEKLDAFQGLVTFIMWKLQENDYAKFGSNLYQKRYVNGRFTYSWTPVMTIRKFITSQCNRLTNHIQWRNATKGGGGNIDRVEKYIMEHEEDDVLTLIKNRHVHSFRNGVFLSKINVGSDECPEWTCKFVPAGEQSEYLSYKTVASKFFDLDFPIVHHDQEEWFDIMDQCPALRGILDYQKFPRDVQRWMAIFIGRCMFDLNEGDRWQVAPYFKGIANSGKTTIIEQVIVNFYEEPDSGMLSNNIQEKFGLSALANKFLVYAPELQKNCSLEQTEWQIMVEGGLLSLSKKFKDPDTKRWTAPVIMAGNQLPGFNNDAGQQSRRTVLFDFKKTVAKDRINPNLPDELKKEIPAIMLMAASGYLWAINKYKGKGIWNILPKYFIEQQANMDRATNPLIDFLKSGKFCFSENNYMPKTLFMEEFKQFCMSYNIPKITMTPDLFTGPFEAEKLKILPGKQKKEYPPGSGEIVLREFITGVDIVTDNEHD